MVIVAILNAFASFFTVLVIMEIMKYSPDRWGTLKAAAVSMYGSLSLLWLMYQAWTATPIFPTQ